MTTRSKPPTSLLLRVQSEATCVTATLAATKMLEAPFDRTEDKALIWCYDLLQNRGGSAEAAALRVGIPANCTLNYLQPKHQDNPLSVSNISDDGYETVVEGGWCVLMTAPSLVALAGVIWSFTTLYMGIGQPQRDNGFVHKAANHKFITRRNKVGPNTWDTRFTIKLEVIGVATDAVQQFVRRVMTNHPFMVWSGKFCCDLIGDFNPQFRCECTSHADIESKWKTAEDERLAYANAGSPAAAVALLPTDATHVLHLPASVLIQQHTPSKASALEPLPQQLSPLVGIPAPQTPTDALPCRLHDAACPKTPPRTILPAFPFQPDSPAKATRLCPDCQSPQLVGRAHNCHSSEPQSKRLKMSICDHPSHMSQYGVGVQLDNEIHTMCDIEKEAFMVLVGKALQMINVDYETVTVQVMVREKKFADLEAIQCSIDCLSECVANRHVGVPSCWLKRTAQKTIDGVCAAFSKQPLMQRTVDHLKRWNETHGRKSALHGVLKDFSESWDLQWDQQKQDLVNTNSWKELQWLTDTRDRLRATICSDASVETANQEDSLKHLLNLKSVFSSIPFPGLDLAIQQVTAQSTMQPEETQCETIVDSEQLSQSELAAASPRQQDFHYVNDMGVARESAAMDTSL